MDRFLSQKFHKDRVVKGIFTLKGAQTEEGQEVWNKDFQVVFDHTALLDNNTNSLEHNIIHLN